MFQYTFIMHYSFIMKTNLCVCFQVPLWVSWTVCSDLCRILCVIQIQTIMFNKPMNTQRTRVTTAVIRVTNEGSIALLGDKEKPVNSIFGKFQNITNNSCNFLGSISVLSIYFILIASLSKSSLLPSGANFGRSVQALQAFPPLCDCNRYHLHLQEVVWDFPRGFINIQRCRRSGD